MRPPENTKVIDTEQSCYWYEDNVLFVITKNAPELPLENRKKRTEEFITSLGGKKVCAIMDISESPPTSKAAREYNSEQLPKIFRAIAFIITKPVSRILAQLYIGVRPLPFPVKMCSSEKEAREWIARQV